MLAARPDLRTASFSSFSYYIYFRSLCTLFNSFQYFSEYYIIVPEGLYIAFQFIDKILTWFHLLITENDIS